MQKVVWAVLFVSLFTVGLVGCKSSNSSSGYGPGNTAEPQLTAIEVTPSDASIAASTSQQFTATGIYTDNSTKDLTALAAWTTSDPALAVTESDVENSSSPSLASIKPLVALPGSVYAREEGTITIRASWGGLLGTGTLRIKRVKLVSISVTPTNPVLAQGTSQQFTATGMFSDNSTQDLTSSTTWSSANSGTAGITASGLATAVAGGTTTITAKYNGISGSTDLTVNSATLLSIAIIPGDASISKGTKQQFAARGAFSDNTTQDLTSSVSWASSNTAVATISNARDRPARQQGWPREQRP